jgi:hypothetical protein
MEPVIEEYDQRADEHEPVMPMADEGDEPDEPIEAPVEALAGELAQTADQYAAAEAAEKAAEGVAVDRDAVFDGSYDPTKAMRAVTEINREVSFAKREYLASKEQTANLKKIYDARVETLTKLIDQYDGRSRDAAQPFLQTVDEARDAETVDARRVRLSSALTAKKCFVTPAGMSSLERVDLDTLDNWLGMADGVIPPELMTKAHIAGEPGTDGAHCQRCGARLGRWSDTEDFPEGAFVGLDCSGEMKEDAVRHTPKRGTKKTKKVDPEGERSAQKAEGIKLAKGNKLSKRKKAS